MNRHNLHVYCSTLSESEVQRFGIGFGAWMYDLNQRMSVEDLYDKGESYIGIDPRIALDYRQKATFHASIVCGYEERRLGR